MKKNEMDQLLELIGNEKVNKILGLIASTEGVVGFRKGKAPTSLLRNKIGMPGKLQQKFLELVVREYFPTEELATMNITTLPDSIETIPGKIAAYAIKGRESEICWPTVETIEDDNRTDDVDTDTEEIERTNIQMITHYLGYVEVVPSAYGDKYYNFYPYAEIRSDGSVMAIDGATRVCLFPTKGNVNIYAATRNNWSLLESTFGNGGVFVIDFDPDTLEWNERNGELNITNRKIDIATLKDKKAIHQANDFNIYPAIEVADVDETLKEQQAVEIKNNIPFEIDRAVLYSSDKLAGPFATFSQSGVLYANPMAKKRNYIFTTYDVPANMDPFVTFVLSIRAFGNTGAEFKYVNLSVAMPQEVDYIPDSELILHLEAYLKQRDETPDNTSNVMLSAFVGTEVPEAIRQNRLRKMQRLLTEQQELDNVLSTCTGVLDSLIKKAAQGGTAAFTDLFERLKDDEEFLSRFQRHRIIKRAIEDIQEERAQEEEKLREKRQELEKLQAECEATQKQIEDKRAAQLSEEIEEKKQELADINASIEEANVELMEALEKNKLVLDMQTIRQEEEEAKKNREYAEKRKAEVDQETNEILRQFEAGTQNALKKLAEAALEPRVAETLDRVMTVTHAEMQVAMDKKLKEQASQYARLCDASTIAPEHLVSTLYERVKKYRNYSLNDVINLFICMAQSRLSVFAGAPGTGKTSICLVIAHALGLDGIQKQTGTLMNRSVLVAVERGWSSKRDFVGYYNPLTKTFDRSNRGVYNALELLNSEAKFEEKEAFPPFLITLDEANLSPMEYYWSDFMAACDSTAPVTIDLGEDAQFEIADSLRFFATINHDHTTESLSPRLVDRAWVVSLPQPTEPAEIEFNDTNPPVSMEQLLMVFGNVQNTDDALEPEAEATLRRVYNFCKENLGISVSPRIMIAIKKFCLAGKRLFVTTRDDEDSAIIAVDYAVSQKILPKIQGNGVTYKNALTEFSTRLRTDNLTRSADILTRIIQSGDNNMHYYQFFS